MLQRKAVSQTARCPVRPPPLAQVLDVYSLLPYELTAQYRPSTSTRIVTKGVENHEPILCRARF